VAGEAAETVDRFLGDWKTSLILFFFFFSLFAREQNSPCSRGERKKELRRKNIKKTADIEKLVEKQYTQFKKLDCGLTLSMERAELGG
jgi:hypothetical protein